MPITDAMRARHVVRQYLSTPLPDDVVAALRSRIKENNRAHASSAPCGGRCGPAACATA